MKIFNVKDKKNFLFKKENIYFSILILIIFIFDRVSKKNIINNFSDSTFYVNDYLNINLIWNIGIGFGFLSTNSALYYNFVTIVIGLVIIYLIYIFVVSENIDKLIFSLILGGAFGNIYDRLIYQAVPDFIDIHYNNIHWFTFNVADIFITLGIMIFILKGFFIKN
tara:strand:- start:555 stop:1052 length:498 start_codon:yes stop_codon:yes gene_type:complete